MTPAARRALSLLGLLGLCAAYLQGGLNKLLDYPGAVAEAGHFGLPLPGAAAAAAIAVELLASAMVLSGRLRRPGALALMLFTLAATAVANRYWEMPEGMERFMTANSFYEHLAPRRRLPARCPLGGRCRAEGGRASAR